MQHSERPRRVAEIAYIVLILTIAGLVWREAGRLPPAPYDPLGPAFFPRSVSVGLAALAAAMALRLVIGRSLGEAAQAMVMGLKREAEHRPSPWTAALTLLLAFAYAALLSFRAVPFFLATMAYLFAAGAILGPFERRRLAAVALFAVAASLALDLLFRRLFKLDLG